MFCFIKLKKYEVEIYLSFLNLTPVLHHFNASNPKFLFFSYLQKSSLLSEVAIRLGCVFVYSYKNKP